MLRVKVVEFRQQMRSGDLRTLNRLFNNNFLLLMGILLRIILKIPFLQNSSVTNGLTVF